MRKIVQWAAAVGLLALTCGAAWFTRARWTPWVWPNSAATASTETEGGHDHPSQDSIVLSKQAQSNLGLKTGPVELTEFWNSIRVPAVVVEQPGHSHRKVTAPLTGMVKQLFVHPSQLVHPGDPIAELELTGDALATTQGDLLQVIREMEVNQTELSRVEALVKQGTLPERNLLELQYERRRLEARREVKIQLLLVLGLSKDQIEEIESSRTLVRSFTVVTPEIASEVRSHPTVRSESPPPDSAPPDGAEKPDWSYTVESIDAFPGKRVQIGDELCSLAFHAFLFLEGQAFEKEGDVVAKAMKEGWPITARFETGVKETLERKGLRILFADNVIDPTNRTFRFFIALPNEVTLDSKGPLGETYRSWLFKPGQKAELDLPTEWKEKAIVLPADAVVRHGLDAYVFRVNGDKFERQAVEIEAKTGAAVVIANNGSIFPGEVIAMNNAYSLNLAIQKAAGQSGGGHGHGHEGHGHSH